MREITRWTFLPQSLLHTGRENCVHSMEEKKFNVSHLTFASSLGVSII